MSGGRIAETATRERIAEALLELMKKKNIDKITVKDVVDHCNITRQTFYYHYQDMMDVFEWICRKKADEMLRLILGMDEAETTIKYFLIEIRRDRDIVNKMMDSRKRMEIEEILLCMTKTFLKGMIKARGLNRELVSLDLEITLNFYSYAIMGIMIELCRKKEIDIDAYAKAILRVLEKGLKR